MTDTTSTETAATSATNDAPTNDVGGIAAGQLRSFIERIERFEEEKANIAKDIKDVYAEAKSSGFDAKIMRQLIKIRKMARDDLAEQDELIELYRRAVNV